MKFLLKWEEDLFNKRSLTLSKIKDPYIFICEHVSFHSDMIKNGNGRLFINPHLIMNQVGDKK